MDKIEPSVLAVSGGVDSIVMLDLLAKQHLSDIIVAHFDHGIRPDSGADARFVAGLAERYGLGFELGRAELGPGASEAEARQARWAWLRETAKKYGSAPISTAHHADDVLETAIINLLRGTGRQGLSSLRETDEIKRPLLGWTKPKIYQYAAANKLEWVEDETNASDDNLRNRVRKYIVPRLSALEVRQLRQIIDEAKERNREIDRMVGELAAQIATFEGGYIIERESFSNLPVSVQRELIRFWMKSTTLRHGELNQLHIQESVEFINTQSRGKLMELPAGLRLIIESKEQAIIFNSSGKSVLKVA